MDLVEVTELVRPHDEREIPAYRSGDAYVAGGTWLFSARQPELRRLIDLSALRWDAVSQTAQHVVIGATASYATLLRHRWADLPGTALIGRAIRLLSSSFKTYPVATFGGNLCLAYAKSMMAPLCVAWDAEYELVTPGGESGATATRRVAAATFQTGDRATIRAAGEYLRSIALPKRVLAQPAALAASSFSATSHVTSVCVAIAEDDGVSLTFSGALTHPVKLDPRLDLAAVCSAARSDSWDRIDAIVAEACDAHEMMNDGHGRPQHRTALLAESARSCLRELVATVDAGKLR